ncbi:hypothetical protein ACOKGD_13715 [Microbacterium phosphatis]|uniref:hypothetical protein n=1 Tax=Microbacterium phosphatis TaxID=3140248 RepID=UPI0031405F11
MSHPRTPARRGFVWAIIGGVIVVAAIVAIILSSVRAQAPTADPTPSSDPGETSDPSATAPATGEFVDETVSERGWVPEPITTDPDAYLRAALAAASTFDTQRSTRPEWLTYLDKWFTPDTRYTSDQDREDDMRASQLELRQGVVLPEDEWNSLANEEGRVTAEVPGEITYDDVPDDASGDMRIGTADVVLTFTRSDGSGSETSYDETVRVSVQVLCGAGSIPTPESAQQPGDCKVVRYFSGSLEP